MTKYHITAKGDPAICHAKKKCRLGGDEEHFDNPDAAREYFESKNKSNVFNTVSSTNNLRKLGQRDLNRLAKESDDPEILNEAAKRGSERVINTLANNVYATPDSLYEASKRTNNRDTAKKLFENLNYPINRVIQNNDIDPYLHEDLYLTAARRINASPETLVAAYDDTNSYYVKESLMTNKNFPISRMDPEDYVDSITDENREYRLGSNHINDEHVEILEKLSDAAKKDRYGYRSIYNDSEKIYLSNPNNKISPEKVKEIVTKKPILLPYAVKGKFDLNKNKDFLNHVLIRRNGLAEIKDPKIAKQLTEWTTNEWNSESDPDAPLTTPEGKKYSDMYYIATKLAANETTPSEALNELSNLPIESSRKKELDEKIFKNPNTQKETKEKLLNESSYIRAIDKVEKMQEKFGGVNGLKKELGVKENSIKIGYAQYNYVYTFDEDKLKEHGLGREEINYFMLDSMMYSGHAFDGWNPETKEFRGFVDSSD